MNYQKLSQIAAIQSGLVLSRKEAKLDSTETYKYKRLNLRAVNEDGSANLNMLDEYQSTQKLGEQFITEKNDIVMRLFAPLSPVMITKDFSGLVVPSQFAMIRVVSQRISPVFLYHYLSRHSMLGTLATREGGHAVRGISISTLSDVPIPLLSLKQQRAIVDFVETNLRRKRLYQKLIQQYDLQADTVIKNVIGGDWL